MSATPNNAGAAWSTPPSGPPEADLGESSGRDALQALLAFACIHEQAARRKGKDSSKTLITKEEEFALDEVLRLVAARAISITGADGVAIAIAEELPLFTTNPDDFKGLEDILTVVPVTRPRTPHDR